MKTLQRPEDPSYKKNMHRRQFLGYVAATTSVITVAAACRKDNTSVSNTSIDLGSGDIGILNYAYALEQLEAAFYSKVVEVPYSNPASADEISFLTDIRDHEIEHREFFKKLLGTNAIPELEIDFTSIDFSSRDSVLATAKAFEDLGVSAYNGAGQLITSADYLLMAGKIVSVEARHAAYIRDILSSSSYGSFADDTIVDANGLDVSASPADVLATASKYLVSKLDGSNLPTN